MEKKTVTVPNIGCNGCVNTIKSEISELAGVKSVAGAVETKQVTIEYEAPTSWDAIVAKLNEIDYPPVQA